MNTVRIGIAAALIFVSVGASAQLSVYDPATGVLTLPAVRVGTATYTNVILLNLGSYTFQLLTATEQLPPGPAEVSYDNASGMLSIPAVVVGENTFINVTLANTGGWIFALRTAYALGSVTVSAATLSPVEGDTVQLSAVARDPEGTVIPNASFRWSSSDTNIATVSTTGLVQTLATGSVVVAATINGVSGAQSLTITAIKVAVTIGNSKEVVFAYKSDHCPDSELDFPDLPPQIVRAEDGSLVLFASAAPRYYVSRSADFDSLKRDCSQPVLVSADLPTPQSYENREWISAVYREGNRWHAIISNEYHDPASSTCRSSDPSIYMDCLYLSATYAVSTDGARTFTKPSPPAHVVAPPPNAWVPPPPGTLPNTGQLIHEGYSAPITIVSKGDGFFYGAVGLTPSMFNPATYEMCLIRTDNLNDPASWRAWDGSGFTVRMTSPYVTGSPAAPLCKLSHEPPGSNITFNTYLDRYMEVGTYRRTIDGKPFKGVYFSLSADLIHWSAQQLIAEIVDESGSPNDPQGQGLLEPVPVLYVKLIDHTDTTVNFERPGRTPYLYYVRFNDAWKDRDLVRVPLTFTRLD